MAIHDLMSLYSAQQQILLPCLSSDVQNQKLEATHRQLVMMTKELPQLRPVQLGEVSSQESGHSTRAAIHCPRAYQCCHSLHRIPASKQVSFDYAASPS